MTPTDEFWGQRRVLEPRNGFVKSQNFGLGKLPLEIVLFQNCFFHLKDHSKLDITAENPAIVPRDKSHTQCGIESNFVCRAYFFNFDFLTIFRSELWNQPTFSEKFFFAIC